MQRKLFLVVQALMFLLFTTAIGVNAAAVAQTSGPNSVDAAPDFQDVPDTNTFYGFLHNIYAAGIVSGYGCGSNPGEPCIAPGNLPYYRLGNSVTRGQMTKFVDLARKQPGIDILADTAAPTPYDNRPLSSRTNASGGTAIYGAHTSTSGLSPAILGETASTANGFLGGAVAVQGVVSSTSPGGFSTAVRGINNGTGGSGIGVWGSHAGSGWGVFGTAGTSGIGVYGIAAANGEGVYGSAGDNGTGVYAKASGGSGIGVYGLHSEAGFGGGTAPGVMGETNATFGGVGVQGRARGISYGVYGEVSGGSFAVAGILSDTTGSGYAIYGKGTGASQRAGFFSGDVTITGGTCTGCAFATYQIDNPSDPENSILTHAAVASPDRMNIYNGNVTTDSKGEAIVSMPTYFSGLNRDFRYQLTPIGTFAQAIVASEISANKFVIKTDKPNVKVSWQVTGVRNDAVAKVETFTVEKDKAPDQKGLYLDPAAYGKPDSLQLDEVKAPKVNVQSPVTPSEQDTK